jgi:hypothetical protein
MKIYKISQIDNSEETENEENIDLSSIDISSKNFILDPAFRSAYNTIIWVNPNIFDKLFSKNKDFYVGAGGENEISGRYNRFKKFLKENTDIKLSAVYITERGEVNFANGRHRYAVMRDMGIPKIPIAIPQECLETARKFNII